MTHTVIRSRERAYALLARLRDQHTLVLLHTVPGDSHPSLSMVLSIDPEAGSLLLDAPVDLDRLELEPDSQVRITANLQGIEVRFRARFESVIEYRGDRALKMAWPEDLKYLERRSDYRVRISGEIAGLELSDVSTDSIEGQIIDLSLGGFGALVEDSPILKQGEVLDCKVEFNELTLVIRAEIRRKSSVSKRGKCHIGARFVEIDQRKQALIGRLVAQLERRAIRTDPTR